MHPTMQALRLTLIFMLLRASRAQGQGLNFDPCTKESDCATGRSCVTALSHFFCLADESKCYCYPPAPFNCALTGAKVCDPGERCATSPALNNFPLCTSERVIASDPDYTIVSSISPPPSPRPTDPSSTAAPTTTQDTTLPPDTTTTTIASVTTTTATVTDPTATSEPPTTVSTTAPSDSTTAAVTVPTTGTTTAVTDPPTTEPVTTAPTGPQVSPTSGAAPTRTPTPTVPDLGGGGLAGDPCGPAPDRCLAYRRCLRKDTKELCSGGSQCVCMGSRVCACNANCRSGEVCTGTATERYCFSPTVVDSIPAATSIPCPANEPTPLPAISPRTGLNGDSCRGDTGCLGSRACLAGTSGNCLQNDVLCDGREQCDLTDRICYCYRDVSCTCSDNCRDSELCIRIRTGNICVSPKLFAVSVWMEEVKCNSTVTGPVVDLATPPLPSATGPALPTPAPGNFTPTPSLMETLSPSEEPSDGEIVEVTQKPTTSVTPSPRPTEDSVCIDAQALHHLPPEELVFDRHSLAAVLCDAYGSCATHGHIVAFHGKVMMMKSYCAIVECTERVMEVNSPRRTRGLRVPSKTGGLEYTAFAARFATRTEEVILSTAIRLGM